MSPAVQNTTPITVKVFQAGLFLYVSPSIPEIYEGLKTLSLICFLLFFSISPFTSEVDLRGEINETSELHSDPQSQYISRTKSASYLKHSECFLTMLVPLILSARLNKAHKTK